MTTRRDVIIGGLAAAVSVSAATGAPSVAANPSGTNVNSANRSGDLASVRLVRQSDSSFLQLMSQYFPGLAANRHFLKISRSAALIFNDDSQALYGYRLLWSSTKAGGASHSYRRRFVNRPTKRLQARQVSAQVPLLGSGDAALVTPFFTWTSQHYRSKSSRNTFSKKRLRRYRTHFPRADGFSHKAKKADSVSMSLEAVAFSTVVVGQKSTSFATRIRNFRNAEHDQALAIYKGIAASSDPTGTAAFKQNLFRGTLSSSAVKSTKSPSYAKSRRRFAKRMERLLNADPFKAHTVLLQVKSTPRLTLR